MHLHVCSLINCFGRLFGSNAVIEVCLRLTQRHKLTWVKFQIFRNLELLKFKSQNLFINDFKLNGQLSKDEMKINQRSYNNLHNSAFEADFQHLMIPSQKIFFCQHLSLILKILNSGIRVGLKTFTHAINVDLNGILMVIFSL